MLEEWLEELKKIEAGKSDLNGADLSGLKLMRGDLSQAKLRDADLSGAYLIRANLSGADLSEANLCKAVLSEADLREANLTETELDEAFLHGADLRGARGLTCEQIEVAHFDQDTRFPDYIQITWTGDKIFACRAQSAAE